MYGTFTSSIYTYCLAICDPGDGKSVTYSKVITPFWKRTPKELVRLLTWKLLHKLAYTTIKWTTKNMDSYQVTKDTGSSHHYRTKKEMGMQRNPSYAKCGVDRVITLRYLVEHEVSRKLQYLPIQPQPL